MQSNSSSCEFYQGELDPDLQVSHAEGTGEVVPKMTVADPCGVYANWLFPFCWMVYDVL